MRTDTVRESDFGMAVYVADGIPVERVEVIGSPETPAIVVTFPAGSGVTIGDRADDDAPGDDRQLRLYSLHTLPPTSADHVAPATRQLDAALDHLAGYDGPLVVIGDLNTSRWGAPFRRLTRETGLRDGAEGAGLGGTWPSGLWFTGMIRIDHVLVSRHLCVDDHEIGPDLGSDHRAVIADLTLLPGS